MLVGFYQFEPIFGDIGGNLSSVEQALSKIDADLIVLPELFNTGYQFISREEAMDLAEDAQIGPTTRRLIEIAAGKQMHIAAGLAERSGNQVFNSAVLVGPAGLITVYRKTHLFDEEFL